MRPSAAASRMAQASVERRKAERVPGVDMMESPCGECALHTKETCELRCYEVFREGRRADGTSYNNSVSA